MASSGWPLYAPVRQVDDDGANDGLTRHAEQREERPGQHLRPHDARHHAHNVDLEIERQFEVTLRSGLTSEVAADRPAGLTGRGGSRGRRSRSIG